MEVSSSASTSVAPERMLDCTVAQKVRSIGIPSSPDQFPSSSRHTDRHVRLFTQWWWAEEPRSPVLLREVAHPPTAWGQANEQSELRASYHSAGKTSLSPCLMLQGIACRAGQVLHIDICSAARPPKGHQGHRVAPLMSVEFVFAARAKATLGAYAGGVMMATKRKIETRRRLCPTMTFSRTR